MVDLRPAVVDATAVESPVGYRQVEFAGVYASSLHQTATILKRYGLFAPSGHVNYAKLERELPVAIQAANELGQKFIVCPYLDERDRRKLDDWKRVCDRFNEIGKQARKAGLSFAYRKATHAIDGQCTLFAHLHSDARCSTPFERGVFISEPFEFGL